MRTYIDQLRDLAAAHGGLFPGTTGVIHQALSDLPGYRPAITRATLREFPQVPVAIDRSREPPGLDDHRVT